MVAFICQPCSEPSRHSAPPHTQSRALPGSPQRPTQGSTRSTQIWRDSVTWEAGTGFTGPDGPHQPRTLPHIPANSLYVPADLHNPFPPPLIPPNLTEDPFDRRNPCINVYQSHRHVTRHRPRSLKRHRPRCGHAPATSSPRICTSTWDRCRRWFALHLLIAAERWLAHLWVSAARTALLGERTAGIGPGLRHPLLAPRIHAQVIELYHVGNLLAQFA